MYAITKTASDAQTALAETGRSSRVVGWGDPPVGPYTQNGWTLEILKTESTIPTEVKTRLNLLRKNGVKFSHILIAHELPKPLKRFEIPREIVDTASKALPVVGAILWAVVSIVGFLLTVVGQILITVLTLDPVVIVVLEDKTWLEVAKWYD